MIYRGPGFLAAVWFGSSLPPPPASKQARPATHRQTEKERPVADVRWGEGGGRRAESYDCKTARSSINHSILCNWNNLGGKHASTCLPKGAGGGAARRARCYLHMSFLNQSDAFFLLLEGRLYGPKCINFPNFLTAKVFILNCHISDQVSKFCYFLPSSKQFQNGRRKANRCRGQSPYF